MVSKTLIQILALLLCFGSEALAQDKLEFNWFGDKSEKCQKIVSPFLQELRSIANDMLIEINSVTLKSDSKINLSCDENSIKISDGKHQDELSIKYLGDKAGFDSLDWIVFQKRYFKTGSDNAVDKNLSDLKPVNLNSSNNLSAIDKSEIDGKNQQKNILIYSFVGIAAGALGGALLSPDVENVEINAIVFGAAGGLAGAGISLVNF